MSDLALCPTCGRRLRLMVDGRFRNHGPVGFECPSSGHRASAEDRIEEPMIPAGAPMRTSPVPWISDSHWDTVSRIAAQMDQRANMGASSLPSRWL